MTKNKVVMFVVISIQFLFTSHVQMSPEDAAFLRRARVVRDIFATVGDVFVTLKNGNNFTTSKHAADNLLIHKFIKNVKDIYAGQYEEIYNISRAPNYDEKTKYIILVISKTLHRIIKKEWKNYNKSEVIMMSVLKGAAGAGETASRARGGGALFDFVRFERNFRRGAELTSAVVAGSLLFERSKQLSARAPARPQVDRDGEAWEPAAPTRRLLGGRAASVAQFPFVCSVHVGGELACAGAILSKRAVITAASCLQRFHSSPLEPRVALAVRAGSDVAGAAGVLVPVRRAVFHARFDAGSLSHNLAILELQEGLHFGYGIRKIKFDTEAAALPENVRDILALGWGASNVTQVEGVVFRDSALSAAVEAVYDIDRCREAYSSYYVDDTHFCTGLVDRGSGPCSSDVGGAGVAGSVLVGLVSFGPARCGARSQPAVYTKLSYYADWIADVTDQIAEKYATKRQKKQKNNETDLDSIKQFVGELKEVLRTKSDVTAGLAGVEARRYHSEDEIEVLKNILRTGPEEEKDPELAESNVKIPTHGLLKSKFKKQKIYSPDLIRRIQESSNKTSSVNSLGSQVKTPRLWSPPTVTQTRNIELEMAYESSGSETNSSNARTYSSGSVDDDSSETEEITIPLDDTKLFEEEIDNDYPETIS